MPALILMTDQNRVSDPVAAMRTLPAGSAVILRHTDSRARATLAYAMAKIARARGLILLIAADAPLAARVGADGIHLPEARSHEAVHWRAMRPHWLITAAAHSVHGLTKAARARADAVLLAPVFPTLSHSNRTPLGPCRSRLMAARSLIPVYALGGVNAQTVGHLKGARLAGIAAIEGMLSG